MGQRLILSEEEKRHIKEMYGLINEEEKLGCIEGDCENGKGKQILKEPYRKYEGDFKNGKYHGKGKSEFNDGSGLEKYEGDFENGRYHGEGQFTYPSGRIIKGTWENGEFKGGKNNCLEGDCENGTGKEVWENGTTYEGEFSGGNLEGKGKLTLPDGKVHDGYFYKNYFIGDINDNIKNGILNKGWVIMKGSHGQESKIPGIKDAIRRIQAVVLKPSQVDGIFGPKTEAEVKGYQKSMNLTVDGKVGKNTLTSMINAKYPIDKF